MHRPIAFLLIASIPATLLAQGQSGPRAEPPRAITLERFRGDGLPFASYSGIDDSLRLVVRDAQAWRAVWQTIHRRAAPMPPVPPVDFAREMIVVAALGARPSGGFAIRVDSVIHLGDSLEVVVRKDLPGRSCLLSAAVTQPVDLARVPARPLPVRFRERSVVEPCN
jgi:hypothetical protein